ncbi:hypothetical protein ACNKHL_21550 [Shigella flexneri]
MLMAGWGMQRQQFGEQKHWMMRSAGGNVGRMAAGPGSSFRLSYHFANGGNPRGVLRCSLHAGQLAGWLRCGG